MLWETTEPLPRAVKVGDRIAIVESPYGALTLDWKEEGWTWNEVPPKCVYGVSPCPALEERFRQVFGPRIREWLAKHQPA